MSGLMTPEGPIVMRPPTEAEVGGGVWLQVEGQTRLTLHESALQTNTAWADGGGLYAVSRRVSDGEVRSFLSDWGAPGPNDNLPNDFAIRGKGSTDALAGIESFGCWPLDARCL